MSRITQADVVHKARDLVREAKDKVKLARLVLTGTSTDGAINQVDETCKDLEHLENVLNQWHLKELETAAFGTGKRLP